MKRGSISIIIVIILLGGVLYFMRPPDKDKVNFGPNVLSLIYSRSVGQLQQICGAHPSSLAPTWVPRTSEYLQKNYGTVQDVELLSYKTIQTKGPLGKVEEGSWQVHAMRGSYKMMTVVCIREDKLWTISFQFRPSSEWISVTDPTKWTPAQSAKR